MRILPLFCVSLSCIPNNMDECRLYPNGYNALLFLERIDENWDCPTDVVLYAHTTSVGGFVNASTNENEQYTHDQNACKTTGVVHLDGVDLRSVEDLQNVKIAYTIYMHEPPHGMAIARIDDMCQDGEYGVYVGVRP